MEFKMRDHFEQYFSSILSDGFSAVNAATFISLLNKRVDRNLEPTNSLIDAIMESTAASTYFPSHSDHIDGGMAADALRRSRPVSRATLCEMLHGDQYRRINSALSKSVALDYISEIPLLIH
jgi:hypothetical protein